MFLIPLSVMIQRHVALEEGILNQGSKFESSSTLFTAFSPTALPSQYMGGGVNISSYLFHQNWWISTNSATVLKDHKDRIALKETYMALCLDLMWVGVASSHLTLQILSMIIHNRLISANKSPNKAKRMSSQQSLRNPYRNSQFPNLSHMELSPHYQVPRTDLLVDNVPQGQQSVKHSMATHTHSQEPSIAYNSKTFDEDQGFATG